MSKQFRVVCSGIALVVVLVASTVPARAEGATVGTSASRRTASSSRPATATPPPTVPVNGPTTESLALPSVSASAGTQLSAQEYQALLFVLRQVPANQQQMTIRSLQKLSASALHRELGLWVTALRTTRTQVLVELVQIGSMITALLPPPYDQLFVDGAWNVSPQAQQFFNAVIAYVARMVNPGMVVSPGASLPGVLDPGLYDSWRGVYCALGGGQRIGSSCVYGTF